MCKNFPSPYTQTTEDGEDRQIDSFSYMADLPFSQKKIEGRNPYNNIQFLKGPIKPMEEKVPKTCGPW